MHSQTFSSLNVCLCVCIHIQDILKLTFWTVQASNQDCETTLTEAALPGILP